MTSNERIIEILLTLLSGKTINSTKLALLYNVDIRTIQRDISTIKHSVEQADYQLKKDYHSKDYYLINPHKLIFEDTLGITKILLASRAFQLEEMEQLLTNLISLNPKKDADSIKQSIHNELTFYYPLEHNQGLLDSIKEMEQFIIDKKVLNITYQKNDKNITSRKVLPVSLFFSDYYFYVICYELEKERYINLRLDRFISIQQQTDTFKIPHNMKLENKTLREQMILMQYGRKSTFTFQFSGIVEAALDKFPNSKVIKEHRDGSVEIEATAYDKGALMWLLSQGSLARVISPPSFVKKMKDEVAQMSIYYEKIN